MDASGTPCRHEYVRIYQRKLKGLERRLVATKAWLPVGFKQADFSHLGEGSYCFCAKCRARLFPKRTAAEKAAARLALAQAKEAAANGELDNTMDESTEEVAAVSSAIHVEELEIESVQLEDLDSATVSMPDDEGCRLSDTD